VPSGVGRTSSGEKESPRRRSRTSSASLHPMGTSHLVFGVLRAFGLIFSASVGHPPKRSSHFLHTSPSLFNWHRREQRQRAHQRHSVVPITLDRLCDTGRRGGRPRDMSPQRCRYSMPRPRGHGSRWQRRRGVHEWCRRLAIRAGIPRMAQAAGHRLCPPERTAEKLRQEQDHWGVAGSLDALGCQATSAALFEWYP
jgi:hypothetical protein